MPQEHPTPIGNGKSKAQTEAASEVLNALLLDAAGPLPKYDGPALTCWQYEALCRHALSREYEIPIHEIKTGYLHGPTTTCQNIRHQIDLYWTSHDGVCDFLCIANAKFQKVNIDLTDIMTLLGVQRDIHAHKAMMITNTGYSSSALLQAREKGIALLIVRPSLTLDISSLPKSTAPAVVAQAIEKAATGVPPVYNLNVIHRGFDPGRNARPQPVQVPAPSVPQSAFSPEGSGSQRCGNQHSAIPIHVPNKMISSSSPAPRASGPFGIRRK